MPEKWAAKFGGGFTLPGQSVRFSDQFELKQCESVLHNTKVLGSQSSSLSCVCDHGAFEYE